MSTFDAAKEAELKQYIIFQYIISRGSVAGRLTCRIPADVPPKHGKQVARQKEEASSGSAASSRQTSAAPTPRFRPRGSSVAGGSSSHLLSRHGLHSTGLGRFLNTAVSERWVETVSDTFLNAESCRSC